MAVKPGKSGFGDPLANMISILSYLSNLILPTLLSLHSRHLASFLFPPPHLQVFAQMSFTMSMTPSLITLYKTATGLLPHPILLILLTCSTYFVL